MFRILYLGDIVGTFGRKAVESALPGLKEKYGPDLTIGNVENLTHGVGVSPSALEAMRRAGIEAFTSGNHIWGNPDGLPLLDDPDMKLVRPANVPESREGVGSMLVDVQGVRVLVVNLMGAILTMPTERVTNAFKALDGILKEHEGAYDLAFVDMHAELTAEKEALGHYADGRVTAVMGSHTHVPTADAKILPGGTAYCTDIGRVGAYDSVLGFDSASVVKRFLTGQKSPYALPENGTAEVNGILISADPESGKATELTRIREFVEC